MDEVETIIADAQRAFARRRQEISAVVDPQLRRSEMQTQIEREIEIGRYVVKLLAMREITNL